MSDLKLYYFNQRHRVESPDGSEHTYVRLMDHEIEVARLAAELAEAKREIASLKVLLNER